jgi:MarR family 2-MHQ and catechol resistance regulon transcriptional repressor
MYRLRRAKKLVFESSEKEPESFLDVKNLYIKLIMRSDPANSKTKIDASGVHLWLVLWKAFRSVEAHAHRHIATLDLCLSDFGVLEALLHKGPLTIKELGAKVLLTSGSMTAALDRLERRGLVEREGTADDRRVRMIRLTSKGDELIHKGFGDHKVAMDYAVEGLGQQDRASLVDLLRQLGQSAEQRFLNRGSETSAKSSKKGSREE